jgi:hypothetical protein
VSNCVNTTDSTNTEAPIEIKTTARLRYVAVFKLNEASPSADIQRVEAAFLALPSKIKEIKDFEWGLNNSLEELSKGFFECVSSTFRKCADIGLLDEVISDAEYILKNSNQKN